MFCGNCGQENPTEHHFCSACGKPLQSATEQPHQNGHYSVILSSVPQDAFERFRVAKQLAELMGMSEQETAAKIETAPCIIASMATLADAQALQNKLQPLALGICLRPTGAEDLESLRANGASVRPTVAQLLPPGSSVSTTPLHHAAIWTKVLSPGEVVEHEFSVGTFYRWLGFTALSAFSVVVFLVVKWLHQLTGEVVPLWPLDVFVAVLVVGGLVRYGYYLKVAYAYAFTNRRVLVHKGLFTTLCVSIDYSKITNVIVYEPFYSVFTGTGHVGIDTAGTNQVEAILKYVEQPYEVKKILDATRERLSVTR